MFSSGTRNLVFSEVLEGSDALISSDHRCCTAGLQDSHRRTSRRFARYSRHQTKCGKWRVDLKQAPGLCEALEEQLASFDLPLGEHCLAGLASQACRRPGSLRYRDGSEIKELIALRRRAAGAEAREIAKRIVTARALAKKAWLADMMERGAKGDFHAVSFFKLRQSTKNAQGGYMMRSGGEARAALDLKAFYRRKYTPQDLYSPGFAVEVYNDHIPNNCNAAPFTSKEIEDTLLTTKAGKSTGADGVPYELMFSVMQSPLQTKFLAFFNSVLQGSKPIPSSWLRSQVVFLPKTKRPCQPRDLRPIVLSSTQAKLFTKLLLMRLRKLFPPMTSCQLSGAPGAQSLDGSMTLQHAIRLSQQWKLPLYAVKLDIAQAFDTLSHIAVAKFLATLGPSAEAALLLHMICNSSAALSMGSEHWVQCLLQGLKQGSSYSAELFARVLDHFIAPMLHRWRDKFPTWLQDKRGVMIHAILYADDIVLLCPSRQDALLMLRDIRDTLHAIGLQLALEKCQFICSPGQDPSPLTPSGFPADQPIKHAEAFTYLGVLVGFNVSCATVLARRLAGATSAFSGPTAGFSVGGQLLFRKGCICSMPM